MVKQQAKQEGVVAFLSVLFISLLLIIITTGFIRIMVNEQRQSTDFDQSTKAYFAAESGIEDAAAKLSSGALPTGSACEPFGSLTGIISEPNVEVTCQQVNGTAPVQANASLLPGETFEVNLERADPATAYVKIAWHSESLGSTVWGSAGTNLVPTDWDAANLPAVLKVATVQWPATGSYDATAIENRSMFLRPSNSATTPTFTLPAATTNDPLRQAGLRADQHNASCTETDRSLYCEAIINLGSSIASTNAQLNIKALNRAAQTPIEVTACLTDVTCDTAPLTINQDVAVIDVTARAGSVFRRLTAQYNGDGSLTGTRFGYDYVIFGDEQVCKLLQVERDPTSGDDIGTSNASCP